jgi:hypothetical protein
MSHPTAYIVHEVMFNGYPVHDTRPAAEFGERRVLVKTIGGSSVMVDENDDVVGGSDFIREATSRIRDGLVAFSRDDYLVLVGAPKLTAIATAVAAHRTGGFVRFLVWDNRYMRYEPLDVEDLW